MIKVNIQDAKTHLSRYAKMVKNGETVILCDRNKPFAQLCPLPAKKTAPKKRPLGFDEGRCELPDDQTLADLDHEIASLFGLEEVRK